MPYALSLLNAQSRQYRLDDKVKAEVTSLSRFNVRMLKELIFDLNITDDEVNKEGRTQFLDSVCV